jgi:Right handed beta helix region
MKKLIALVLLYTLAVSTFAQDQKLTGLSPASSGGSGDLLYIVVNPSTSPASRSITVDSLFKGRTGNNSVLAYASLAAAESAIGSSAATIEIPATAAVSADLTIAANHTLIFTGTGNVSTSSGKTLTYYGATNQWPSRQIATGSGTLLTPNADSINPKWFGAKNEAKQVTDGAMSSSGNTVTCSTSQPFTSAMVGWAIDVSGSGASVSDIQGITARHNQFGTITGFTSSSVVSVSFTASATVSGKTVTFGPDASNAVLAAKAAKGTATSNVHFPSGNYVVNSQVALSSGMSITGDGQGVSSIYWVGPTRNSGTGANLFSIPDGVSNITIADLSIIGTNYSSAAPTSVAGLYFAIRLSTGAGGKIQNVTVRNVEIAYVWGMGVRSDGDTDQTPGVAPSVINVKILDCNIHHNSDNGINVNNGGGLLVRGCKLTDNVVAGIEFAGSRVQILDSYIARNRVAGVALGGLGNPSMGVDNLLRGNLVERNGGSGQASGIIVGGNVIHAIISNNIVRENELQGIAVSDGNPDFANLSRDIRVVHNQVISNGSVFPGKGIVAAIDDVVVEDNDIFDDSVGGFSQYYGILVSSCDGAKILRNRVRNNAGFDYEFVLNTHTLLVRDDATGTLQQLDANGYAGTADTSSTTATWKSGILFSTKWVGVPIKVNSVSYTISAVAAAPSGNFTSSGLTITRTSGTNFNTAWAGKYIKLGPSYYFLIASVADASHLTISNGVGNAVPASGTWTLNGSVSATLSTSAGTQTGVAYVIPPHVVYPDQTVNSLTFADGSTVAERLLITVPGVNMHSASKQALYTVPSGKHLVVTKIIILPPGSDISDGLFGVGFDAGADDFMNSIIGPTTTKAIIYQPDSTIIGDGFIVGNAGEVFGLHAQSPPANTTTATILIFGYLY